MIKKNQQKQKLRVKFVSFSIHILKAANTSSPYNADARYFETTYTRRKAHFGPSEIEIDCFQRPAHSPRAIKAGRRRPVVRRADQRTRRSSVIESSRRSTSLLAPSSRTACRSVARRLISQLARHVAAVLITADTKRRRSPGPTGTVRPVLPLGRNSQPPSAMTGDLRREICVRMAYLGSIRRSRKRGKSGGLPTTKKKKSKKSQAF